MKTVCERSDYVIVGGGSAGCALAHCLTTTISASVLLLEADPGVLPPMARDASSWPLVLGSEYDWKYRTVRQAHLSEEADLHCLARGIEMARAIGCAAPLDMWRLREVVPRPEAGAMEALHRFVRQAVCTWYIVDPGARISVTFDVVGDACATTRV